MDTRADAKAELAALLREKMPCLRDSQEFYAAKVREALRRDGLPWLLENPNFWVYCLRGVH